MVVSEMGEQWSPHTAPAQQAEMPMMSSLLEAGKIAVTMESTKTRILKKLLETDGYLSGQELCEQLGVSRTAVWKYMKQLKEEGYEIDGKWYYFNTASDKGTLGAMLANTTTPDGYQVDANGAWIR